MRQGPKPADRKGSRNGSDSRTGASDAPRRWKPVGYCRGYYTSMNSTAPMQVHGSGMRFGEFEQQPLLL